MNLPPVLRDYAIPVGVSAVLHAALIVVLLMSWPSEDLKQEVKRPNFVQATLVQMEDKPTSQQPKPKENKPNVVDLTKKRQAEQEKKKIAEQKRAAEQKQAQELKRQQELERKKKAESEQKRQEAERQKQEADRKKQEADRKKREQAAAEQKKKEQAQRQKEQAALAEALAQEQSELLEASYAEAAQSYMGAISQRVEQNWNRPPSARNGMEAELLIKLVPTGRVVSADVVRSSGNTQFDRSAVQAVTKAEQFPEVKNMAPEVFERYYRELRLVFRPQDLRQ